MMAAPGTAAPKQPNGLKKLFGRRTATHKETPPSAATDTNLQTPRNSNTTSKPSLAASRSERKKGKRWGSVFTKKETTASGTLTNEGTKEGNVVTVQDHQSPVRIIQKHRPSSPPPSKLTTKDFVPWQTSLKEEDPNKTLLLQKQLVKERDGFCRRVDSYDGQVIAVAGRPAYELGSYLGGGVAGVVYEGHRLRPLEEYPVRLGRGLGQNDTFDLDNHSLMDTRTQSKEGASILPPPEEPPGLIDVGLFSCLPNAEAAQAAVQDETVVGNKPPPRNGSVLTWDSAVDEASLTRRSRVAQDDAALEMTASNDQMVLIDEPDGPSRSSHYAKAVSMRHVESANSATDQFPSDASITYSLMEETVAVKVLNPVGFRTMDSDALQSAVVARQGDDLERAVLDGKHPMEQRHVWWLVNPNSRNLRTLQRYPAEQKGPRRVQVDRGSAEKGLRISLIAAYCDGSNTLRELPLTRCIEIWGHVPFGASDEAFSALVSAIDAINSGKSAPNLPAFWDLHQTQPIFNDAVVPGRIGTASTANTLAPDDASLESLPMQSRRTGIFRAATSSRTTVYCNDLSAHIALPAVPSKYIKWLRQRRAATKEIRNMMLIGRHRNVVHLFEVLEHIQENKSTMFLILELVRGGELFDLISSGAAKLNRGETIPPGFTETETVMRKFFSELAAGIRYCHSNGIAHRDLKPENLLVHNALTGECTLKIADFGLSAAFGPNGEAQQYDDITLAESYISSMGHTAQTQDDGSLAGAASIATNPHATANPVSGESPIKRSVDRILTASGSALSFFTCGVVDEVIINSCGPGTGVDEDGPSALKRMTSVVGSPHYVAPEIISQNDHRRRDKKDEATNPVVGYDGTKADVWSAGVILYAMLFRSLPFGEDLLRCPRYQSFSKWYAEVKTQKGRRSTPTGFLQPLQESEKRELLGPQWFFPSHSSPESRDLIVAMLNPDPDVRPSIIQILQHTWLAKAVEKTGRKR